MCGVVTGVFSEEKKEVADSFGLVKDGALSGLYENICAIALTGAKPCYSSAIFSGGCANAFPFGAKRWLLRKFLWRDARVADWNCLLSS